MKHVVVITGAPGTGKTTVRNYLTQKYSMSKILTHTTRPKRQGEIDGVDYYFETNESFDQNHFLEHVEYDDKKYGSSIEGLQRAWKENDWAAVVLDTKGAISYLQQKPAETLILYLETSNQKKQAQRLASRGDSSVLIKKRLASQEAKRDLKLPQELHQKAHLLLNDDWEQTKHYLDAWLVKAGWQVSVDQTSAK
ncbi:guanylate kinase [Ligilactobacillus pobuzihii]|uniref:Guanylate kinase n=1 Tax=Ligilactobacillus pobuzihii TaxID=449659 RepID=A0A0R2LBM0_9LACO|nr:AAA family ATPase [Ligilactobacillus pobuzihii]KRK09201.1 Guanylate kinase [Ligilactobacillus pobuzihii E100301 = KCTC 13174]KRN99359.1 Guanylate kinase [Ligilactobacillus pobuzihii]GEN49139.1 guanylate kinase [Ligilactobacillus pobuzihii]